MIVCRGLGTTKALLATAGLGRWGGDIAMLGDRCCLIRPERRLELAAERSTAVAADARAARVPAGRVLAILRDRRPLPAAEPLVCRLEPERVMVVPAAARVWVVAGGRWVAVLAGRETAVLPTRH